MREKQPWINPIEGQIFTTNKGPFEVVGLWRNENLDLIGIEIQDEKGNITEVTPEAFQKNEHKINYVN